MKTYSKKKNDEEENEIIVDLNDVCRLCMGKEEEMHPIFSLSQEEVVPLTLRIMACVSLEVFEGDGLPDKICKSCKFQLEKSYNFRKKCELSDMKLRQHMRELREEEMDYEAEESREEEFSKSQSSADESKDVQSAPKTVEDLVGITKVTYIQQDPEQESEHHLKNITLPLETDCAIKEACTLESVGPVKAEEELEDQMNANESLLEPSDDQMEAIANAVKATLASQPGFDMNGRIEMKVNQVDGKATQVEVTGNDGSIIVMELTAEVENEETRSLDQTVFEEFNEEGELNVFQCPDCPKAFSRRIQLRRHASVHMQQRGYSCGICEKWFPTRSALIRHERIHTGERPFQCEVCQKSFAQKEILFRHLMTHTGQKPYSCPQCDKGFSQREPLRVHMRTHLNTSSMNIQLHYCSLCPKVFCHASGLSRHLVTHTGKTFKCRDCDKTFTDKSSLRRHLLSSSCQTENT